MFIKLNKKKAPITLMASLLVTAQMVSPGSAWSLAEVVQEPSQGVGFSQPKDPSIGSGVSKVTVEPSPYQLAIPESNGRIEEVHQGANGSPLVVYIQSVHANFEAQQNIKAILHHLTGQYGFSVVQLEGAASKLDPAIFQPSYLHEVNEKLVEFLLREGRITGADAFAVETNKPVQLYGMEDEGLYLENLKMFRTVYGHRDEVNQFFERVRALMGKIGFAVLAPEPLDFTRKAEAYSQHRIDLLDYLLDLEKFAVSRRAPSLSGPEAVLDFPNLYRLFRLHTLEKKLDKQALEKEKKALLRTLTDRLPESERTAAELLQKLDKPGAGSRPRDYLLELTRLGDEAGIDFIGYPQVQMYGEYLILQDEVDHLGVFPELERFENGIKNVLFTTPDEQLFLELIDTVNLLESFFRLEMSRTELAGYWKAREKARPSWIAERLNQMARQVQVEEAAGDAARLDSYMNELEYYYQLVLNRDRVFAEKIMSKMRELGQDKTIVIAGGFHKDGLMDVLRKQNVSYVIVNPDVDVEQGNEHYVKVILEENAVVGGVFSGAFALEVPHLLLGTQRFQLSLVYALASLQTQLESPEGFREQMEDRFAALRARSGLRIEILSDEISGNTVTQQLDVTYSGLNGKTHHVVLRTELYGRNGEFSIQVVSADKVTDSAAFYDRTRLTGFDQLVGRVTSVKEAPRAESGALNRIVVLDQVLLVEGLPRALLPLVGNQRAARSFYEKLRRAERAGSDSTQVDIAAWVNEAVRSTAVGRQVSSEAIEEGISDETVRAQLKFLGYGSEQPVFVLGEILEEGNEEAQLRSITGVLQQNPGASAHVYGKGALALLDSMEIEGGVTSRIKAVDADDTETAVKQLVLDLKRGSYFNSAVSAAGRAKARRLSRVELYEKGHIRLYLPNGVDLKDRIASIPYLKPVLLESVSSNPKVQGGTSELRKGVVEIQTRFITLDRELYARLDKAGLADVFVEKDGRWVINEGFLELIRQLYVAQLAAQEIAKGA